MVNTQAPSAGPTDDQRHAEMPLIAFPTERYPTGWFQIGWSDEVPVGAVKQVHYFGKNLVMWRGESGDINVLDAYCLHNGANLAVQGAVVGDDIRCPWHGWQWAGDGRNTCIPYGAQPCKPNLRMRAWEVRDYYGAILVWHDLANRESFWEPPSWPEMESEEFYDIQADNRHQWRIKAHVQNPGENSADFAHIKWVHGANEPPVYAETAYRDHIYAGRTELTYGGGKKNTALTPDGPTTVMLDQGLHGLGLGHNRWNPPMLRGLLLVNQTPIDDTYCDMFFMMTTERIPGHDRPEGIARKMIDHQLKTVAQDFFTWEHMQYLERPNLTPEETKTWGLFRKWASQFYPATDPRLKGGEPMSVRFELLSEST